MTLFCDSFRRDGLSRPLEQSFYSSSPSLAPILGHLWLSGTQSGSRNESEACILCAWSRVRFGAGYDMLVTSVCCGEMRVGDGFTICDDWGF